MNKSRSLSEMIWAISESLLLADLLFQSEHFTDGLLISKESSTFLKLLSSFSQLYEQQGIQGSGLNQQSGTYSHLYG